MLAAAGSWNAVCPSTVADCSCFVIISVEHRVLFVHVWKTGGTSIAAALRDGLRLGHPTPWQIASRRVGTFIDRRLGRTVLGKHAHALDMRQRLGAEYDRYFSFGFVRNPWDWLVSWYNFVTAASVSPDTGRPWRHHMYPTVAGKSFDEFVRWVVEEDGLGQTQGRRSSSFSGRSPVLQRDWLSDLDGRLIVKFVGKYENLARDFAIVAEAIGRPDLRLLHINKGVRADYREYYSPTMRDAVGEYFLLDIETFGYEF